MKSLTVATYNVHMWCDNNHSETQDRMIELTKVICTVFENHSKYLIFKTSKRTKFIYRQIIFEFSRQNSIPKCILNETFTIIKAYKDEKIETKNKLLLQSFSMNAWRIYVWVLIPKIYK